MFTGLVVATALLQLTVNSFVFVVWLKAFLERKGFEKFVALWGVVVPVVMASITIIRILLPYVLNILLNH